MLYQGRSYKELSRHGHAGRDAAGPADRYFQEGGRTELAKLVPEGIEGRVPYKGSLATIVFQLVGGLRAGMGYCGARIDEMHEARVRRDHSAGLRESHPHDMQITKEAPNYGMEE